MIICSLNIVLLNESFLQVNAFLLLTKAYRITLQCDMFDNYIFQSGI